MKRLNLDLDQAGKDRLLQLNELEELRNDAYDGSKIYKAWTKTFHDKHIVKKSFEAWQKAWLFNSRLKFFPRKLRTKWEGSYLIIFVSPYQAVKLQNLKDEGTFKVNGQRLKPYIDGQALQRNVESDLLVDRIYFED
ncbi:uncharacterized protein LOC132277519 [Cornus florida]|uniref:uncharacterized protein LOC132277519 n=1 Tax=Cornus florida TaxID=4283 RepID=UPI0028A2B5C3|nr:uncharacterized protein LOC132277519 [Cornus florida]